MAQTLRLADIGEPVTPSKIESAEAGRVVDFFSKQNVIGTPKLVSETGEEVGLPSSVFRILRAVAEEMAKGNAVAVLPYHHELTTQQAADLLNVSRPYLIGLLEDGQIPFHLVGRHRRVRLDDLLAYKHHRDGARRETLKRLTRDSQDMGLDY